MRRPHTPVDIRELRLFNPEPNLTAILPGKCQARCPFCVEPEGPAPHSLPEWLQAFTTLLEGLPPLFRVLSLSGGEPTISPLFREALYPIRRARESNQLTRVVLTTNGATKSLQAYIDEITHSITHVNISRHSADEILNRRVFHGNVPSSVELRQTVAMLNAQGIRVNINCVYSSAHAFGAQVKEYRPGELRDTAIRFIDSAQRLGASSVVFRYDHRSQFEARPTFLESLFDDVKTIHYSTCASCRVVGKILNGLPVYFKRSAYEPIQFHYAGELYELVFHSDGRLYRDWSRQHPVLTPLPRAIPSEDWWRLHKASAGDPTLVLDCETPMPTCNLMTFSERSDPTSGDSSTLHPVWLLQVELHEGLWKWGPYFDREDRRRLDEIDMSEHDVVETIIDQCSVTIFRSRASPNFGWGVSLGHSVVD